MIGWILWALVMAFATKRALDPTEEPNEPRAAERRLVALAGIGELAMATLLTGVHERYLVHAVALLLLAAQPGWRRVLGWATGALAGTFVLASLHDDALTGPLRLLGRPEPLAVVSSLWLIAWLVPQSPARAAPEPVAPPRSSG